MAADCERDDDGLRAGSDRRRSEELAHALLLEAVDGIRQARDLLAGGEACVALNDNADALAGIARQLAPPRRCRVERND